MKFNTLFPEMIGLEWGNSALDLGDEEIGRLEDGVAWSKGRTNSNSLSWKAVRLEDGRVRVDIRDNSKSDEDSRSESGSVVLPAVPGKLQHNTTGDEMEDYREDGYNAGRGQAWRNDHHEPPQTDGDRYSYRAGYEEGERRRRVADEIDRELYGDDRW